MVAPTRPALLLYEAMYCSTSRRSKSDRKSALAPESSCSLVTTYSGNGNRLGELEVILLEGGDESKGELLPVSGIGREGVGLDVELESLGLGGNEGNAGASVVGGLLYGEIHEKDGR